MRIRRLALVYFLAINLLLACSTPGPDPRPVTGAKDPAKPVVVSLANSARRAQQSGQHEQAASYLERALRIEPNDPRLWHRLAKVRYDQGRYQQAVNLAKRSIALAGADTVLRRQNWSMIADALAALGEHDQAAAARRQAR
jgi:tetratricopeptide (TPR) repeat protein